MKRKNLIAFVSLTAMIVGLSTLNAQDEKKFDVKKMMGEWTYESGMKAGAESEEHTLAGVVTITKKLFKMPMPDGSDGFEMSYTIDESKSPVEIDIAIEKGPVPQGKAVGIISVSDDTIKLCYNAMGGSRPESFESTEDNGAFLFVLKRKSSDFAPESIIGTWAYSTGNRKGENVPEERLAGDVVVTKDTFTLPAGPDSTFVMAYEIDADKTPVEIDLQIKEGPVPDGKALGIIKVEDDVMTLCYDPTGQNRPAKFATSDDQEWFMFELKKKD